VAEQVLAMTGENRLFWETDNILDEEYLSRLGLDDLVAQLISGSHS